MKTIKLGAINFYNHEIHGCIGRTRLHWLIELYINKFDLHFELVDCLKEECDIVFYSLWGPKSNLDLVKGNPKFVYWADENLCGGYDNIHSDEVLPFNYYKSDNYSLSFYMDSDTNLFFPMWLLFDLQEMEKYKRYDIKYEEKTKFASFIASNSNFYYSCYRNAFVDCLNNYYKRVDCMGSCMHNTDFYLPFNAEEAVKIHEPYKFNICFENSKSEGNLLYVTEKIINAYKYNTIPIYWGAQNMDLLFNKDSYINANDKTFSQVIEEIKMVENNKELFEYMINQNPINSRFMENVGKEQGLFDVFVVRFVQFMKKILDDK